MAKKDSIEPLDILTISQAAKLLCCCTKTLRRWDKDGTLKAYRTPSNQRFYLKKELINRFLRQK